MTLNLSEDPSRAGTTSSRDAVTQDLIDWLEQACATAGSFDKGENMSQVENIPYAELEVGQKAKYTSSIAERDLQLFAAVSGDRNPVHLDAIRPHHLEQNASPTACSAAP